MGLTTKEKVKIELGIPSTDTSKDALIDSYIDIISSKIETICGRTFEQTSYTDEEYIGTDTTKLILRNYPIISIEKIEVDEVEIDDYELQKDKVIGSVFRLNRWESKRYRNLISNSPLGSPNQADRNIKVDYTAGYATIPFDLEDVATQEVVRRYEKRYGSGDLKSWKLGNSSKTYNQNEVDPQSGFLMANYNYLVGNYKNFALV